MFVPMTIQAVALMVYNKFLDLKIPRIHIFHFLIVMAPNPINIIHKLFRLYSRLQLLAEWP